MGKVGKKFWKLFSKKESVKLIVYVQSSNLGGFFTGMPLQYWYVTQLNYFQKYRFYQDRGKMWGDVIKATIV